MAVVGNIRDMKRIYDFMPALRQCSERCVCDQKQFFIV